MMYINTPVGKFRVPQHEVDRLVAMSNDEVLAAIDVSGFIDPFALHEAMARGIWRDSRPAPGCTMAEQIERMTRND